MLSKKLLFVCVSCLTLTACSVDEIAAVNKKISDGAFALTGALRGNNSSTADNGMPWLSQKAPTKRDKRENVTEIPVDVDTAAGRLKRYYKFYSNGKGSRLYITYASPAPGHLKEATLAPLFNRVKDVAEGRVR
ncbi:hypothetical protein NFL66_19910 [Escherichia coli]|nr:hypothetical protein NFL66_19910 [Escherichia coli]